MNASAEVTRLTHTARGRLLATLLITGLISLGVLLGLPAGASANHQGYCGYGVGYVRVHWDPSHAANYEYRMVFVFEYQTRYFEVHVYHNQKNYCAFIFWDCGFHTIGTVTTPYCP
jgi:hypothetical protein